MSTLKHYLTELSNSEINSLEAYLDKIFAVLDVDVEFTRHFKERLQGREDTVKIAEIKSTFNKMLKKHQEKIIKSPKAKSVLQDLSNNLNVPFVVEKLKDGTYELNTLTIMKKKGFKPGFDTKKLFKV